MPTYNEAESIRGMVERVRRSVPDADLLIIDDGSPDGTGAIADDLAATDDRVSVRHRAAKSGLGSAYLLGFGIAAEQNYDAVVEIDADGSHDPAELPAMLALLEKRRADLVIGSRWIDGGSVVNWPWARRAISRSGNRYAKWMLRSSIRDLTAGFRAYRTAALRGLDRAVVSSQGYCFQVELAWRVERSGGVVLEHPITFVERTTGSSKMGPAIVAEALVRVTGWGVASWFGRGPARTASRERAR
ncbi:polyprenol monophosphomannose synthase [Microcella sp.]|uniref:polyprenol monophosphomannose synthase n=1 Tax=Microcella sp. TaxID=1913979 RepID=UPI0025E8E090|nr:polyprenol monophosphomannose synthase [Microcella sp.]